MTKPILGLKPLHEMTDDELAQEYADAYFYLKAINDDGVTDLPETDARLSRRMKDIRDEATRRGIR